MVRLHPIFVCFFDILNNFIDVYNIFGFFFYTDAQIHHSFLTFVLFLNPSFLMSPLLISVSLFGFCCCLFFVSHC